MPHCNALNRVRRSTSTAVRRQKMARGYWVRGLAAWSLLVAPIQSLRSSPPATQQPSCHHHSAHVTCPSHSATASARRPLLANLHRQRQQPLSLLQASTNDMETDDDLDQFMEELFEESVAANANQTKAGTKKDSSHFVQGKTAVGIGGNDGFVYDVNKLKRNLVQESVRGCKQELLVLLGDGRQYGDAAGASKQGGKQNTVTPPRWRKDRDDLIEDRLSSLVQANPVSTTTDSNLLDGEWSFAFATNSASTILDTSRFLLSKTKRTDTPEGGAKGSSDGDRKSVTVRGGPWRFRSGKTENPFRSSTRQIYLENLAGDENAHIIDATRLMGGLFQISRRYDVYGLTRTALDLDLAESESRLFGLLVNSDSKEDYKGTKQGQPLEIQVLYLDNDLCICTTGAGLDGPLHVYTKSDSWVTGGAKRKLRLLAKTASWISTMQSPLRIRERFHNAMSKRKEAANDGNSELKAINIGEVDINKDGTTKEEPAWDGPDDPFMHLSPGERMKVLKTMSLQDIYQSASERKEQNKNEKKKKWGLKRSNKFIRPDDAAKP